jgi:hypothetical protein
MKLLVIKLSPPSRHSIPLWSKYSLNCTQVVITENTISRDVTTYSSIKFFLVFRRNLLPSSSGMKSIQFATCLFDCLKIRHKKWKQLYFFRNVCGLLQDTRHHITERNIIYRQSCRSMRLHSLYD